MIMAKVGCHKLTFAVCIAAALAAMCLVTTEALEAAETEQLLNLTVKDASVAEVLHMIGKAGGVNVVVGEGVTGKIQSITLTDVTFEQALQMICMGQNLHWRKLDSGYVITNQPPTVTVPQPAAPAVVQVPPTPRATLPSAPEGTAVEAAVTPAPPPAVQPGSARVVMEGPDRGREVVVDSIPVRYVDAGDIALMFGGSRVDGDSSGFSGPRVRTNPYTRSRVRGGLASAVSGGFTEMQAPGAPGLGAWGQLGGGFPGGMPGMGGFGAPGGMAGRFGGQLGGQLGGMAGMGGMGGYGGGFTQLLPSGMVEPPIAYMPLNVLLARGTQEAIDEFKDILTLLDQPAKQVQIATKFIEVQTSQDSGFGIDWFVDNGQLAFFNQGLAPGSLQVVRFTRGRFQAELAALLREGRAQVINEPRVTTQNNMPAEVVFSTTIPYVYPQVTYNEFGLRTVDFEVDEVDIENALYVTPRINADDTITLDLEPQIEDQVGTVVSPSGETYPIISSQSVYTRVTVADGETLAIGGLIRKNESVDLRKTPLLSSIPIIGDLFTGRTKNVRNSELIIFVTPTIIRELPRA